MLVPVLALGLAVSRAGPEPRLRWEAPSPCPSASHVQQRLDGLVGDVGDATLRAEAMVEEGPRGFSVRLRLDSATGRDTRTFSADRCDVLAEAVVFVVAVAIDPVAFTGGVLRESPDVSLVGADAALKDASADEDPREAERSEPAAAESTDATPEDEESSDRAEPTDTPLASKESTESTAIPSSDSDGAARRTPRTPIAGGVRIGSSLGVGVLPGLDVLLGGAGIIRGPSFRAELVLQHGFARPARLESLDTAGADLDQWTALGRGCWAYPRARLELAVCGQLEAGAVRARGVGVEDARTRWSSFVGLGIAAGLALRLADRLALWLDGQGFGSPRRPAFSVAGSDSPLHESSAGGARVTVGLELRLGSVDLGR